METVKKLVLIFSIVNLIFLMINLGILSYGVFGKMGHADPETLKKIEDMTLQVEKNSVMSEDQRQIVVQLEKKVDGLGFQMDDMLNQLTKLPLSNVAVAPAVVAPVAVAPAHAAPAHGDPHAAPAHGDAHAVPPTLLNLVPTDEPMQAVAPAPVMPAGPVTAEVPGFDKAVADMQKRLKLLQNSVDKVYSQVRSMKTSDQSLINKISQLQKNIEVINKKVELVSAQTKPEEKPKKASYAMGEPRDLGAYP